MAYQVIARKWRPQTFADVVGQEHVVRTLQNQLLNERTAHAYLLVGPRGIGKTTIARIFAKALNCRQAPVAEPCGQCDSCRAITDGSSLDVIEIDGASNNGVEDVRQLREEVLYTPVSSRYKVYVIDEVHMLTNAAWNALLKTVEEPPPHVKFIFATTEAHKVLATIVSRCQRFDLHRLTTRLIRGQLRRIADAEQIAISDTALTALARAADGGMRDGQSLLDQMISFFSGHPGGIDDAQVLAIFGLTGAADMERLITAVLGNRPAETIAAIHALSAQGKNLEQLLNDILTMLRGVQLCHLCDHPEEILDEGEEMVAVYRRLAADIAPERWQLLLETLAPAGRILHDALNKQVYLESMLLKAMRIAHGVQLADVLRRLNEIRHDGELEVLAQVPPAGHDRPVPVPSPPAPPPPPPPPAPSPSPKPPSVSAPAPPPPPAAPAPDPAPPTTGDLLIAESPAAYQSPVAPPPVVPKPASSDALATAVKSPAKPAGKPVAVRHRESSPEVLWHLLINDMDNYSETKGFLKAHMQAGKPESYADGVLTVVYDEEFEELHIEELRRQLIFLNKCLARVSGNSGATIAVRAVPGVAPAHDDAEAGSHLIGVRQRIENNQFVQSVTDLFEGEIVQVRG